MIASIEIDVVRIDDQGDADEQKHLHTLKTTIDNVAIEYVRILIRWQSILVDSERRKRAATNERLYPAFSLPCER